MTFQHKSLLREEVEGTVYQDMPDVVYEQHLWYHKCFWNQNILKRFLNDSNYFKYFAWNLTWLYRAAVFWHQIVQEEEAWWLTGNRTRQDNDGDGEDHPGEDPEDRDL